VSLVDSTIGRVPGEFAGGGDRHLVADRAGAHVQGAAEEGREGEGVVDLIRVVAPGGAHDPRPRLLGDPRRDLRSRVGAGEVESFPRRFAVLPGGSFVTLEPARYITN
jgi:hypothetical protein